MNAVKRTLSTILICSVALSTPALGQDRTLTMHDVSPDLANLIGNTDLDFVRAAEIKYGYVNKSNYDNFFRSSAIAYGGLVAGQGLVDDATMNIKASARSNSAVASTSRSMSIYILVSAM